jgi:hypothetical protein
VNQGAAALSLGCAWKISSLQLNFPPGDAWLTVLTLQPYSLFSPPKLNVQGMEMHMYAYNQVPTVLRVALHVANAMHTEEFLVVDVNLRVSTCS